MKNFCLVVLGIIQSRYNVLFLQANTFQVWNWRTGKCIKTCYGHTNAVRWKGICVSAESNRDLKLWHHNGKEFLVTASADRTLSIWDIHEEESDKPLFILQGHSGYRIFGHIQVFTSNRYVLSIQIRGDKAISGSTDSTVRIWDLKQRLCTDVLTGHKGQIYCVQVDDNIIASTAHGKPLLQGFDNFFLARPNYQVVEFAWWFTIEYLDRTQGTCLLCQIECQVEFVGLGVERQHNQTMGHQTGHLLSHFDRT